MENVNCFGRSAYTVFIGVGDGLFVFGKTGTYKGWRNGLLYGFAVLSVRLHCYVVVELKTEKLNFYVTAVNKNMKTEQDNQTIGILICKDKDDVVNELPK